ncbi:MAG: acyltransferase, partial [Acidimicrobiia bacterium]|nr:acyltransferase [Acidimicrobiia bacterium]
VDRRRLLGQHGAMTPAGPSVERDRFIDLLRVAGVAIVVLGHWAVFVVFWEGDTIRGVNALSVIPAIRPITWIVQVMPLMFFIGGFSNSRSLDRHGGSVRAFLSNRMIRLLGPTAVFIGVWLVLGVVQAVADLPDPDLLRRAADVAALPFWFLGIYLVAVGLAPAMRTLHERFRWWVPGILVCGAVAVDVVSRGFDLGDVGAVNYLFVWLLAHQAGYFYADGTLPAAGRRGDALLAAAGLAGMAVLITWFGYPVSMVEVPGQPASNTAPPSIALVFLALWLIGLAMLLRGPLARWLERDRPWRVVTRLNRIVLTAYLWHVTAITASVAILYPLGFPQPEIGTPQWWLLRPVFVASMVPLLVALLAVFGRFEIHPVTVVARGRFDARSIAAMAFGTFALAVCLLGFGITGFIELADAEGASLLNFQFNPLQNVLHGWWGVAAVAAALRYPRWAVTATLAGGVLFLAGGWIELGDAGTILGMNDLTAMAHLVSGALAVVGGLAGAERAGRPYERGRRSGAASR